MEKVKIKGKKGKFLLTDALNELLSRIEPKGALKNFSVSFEVEDGKGGKIRYVGEKNEAGIALKKEKFSLSLQRWLSA